MVGWRCDGIPMLALPTTGQDVGISTQPKIITNKKVLLRERKRHTARCVANTRYVVLTGYPPPPRGGVRYPPRGVQVPRPGGGGYPDPPSPPPVDRQTPVKTVPSRRTTYAGGNKHVQQCKLYEVIHLLTNFGWIHTYLHEIRQPYWPQCRGMLTMHLPHNQQLRISCHRKFQR